MNDSSEGGRAQTGPTTTAGLSWTGHPLVDMGIATLVAFAERAQPEEVTLADLERFAAYAEQAVFSPTLRSHASVLYTINAEYLNPSFDEPRRRENAGILFRRFAGQPEPGLPPCAYCGAPAVKAARSSGPGYRDVVPMLTGRGILNFFPYGQHGLPLCGRCVTALQALPFGAPSCEGRALVVSSDDPSAVVGLIKDWLPEVRTRVQLSQATGQKVETWRSPRTRLIERLVRLERHKEEFSPRPAGLTIYHLTNSGQGPTLAIYTLPASVVRFVRRAQAQAYHRAWAGIERRAWLDAKNKAAERSPAADERLAWRNRFYEALFELPRNTAPFVRRHFLAAQQRSIKEGQSGDRVPLWGLAQLFLQEVLGMEPTRIEAIRNLGDAIAEEVTNDDPRLFQRAYQIRSYYALRRLLIQASSRRLAHGQAPLLTFDGFLTVFEVGDELPRTDWRLAWDLALIRLIDELHAKGWFRRHKEAVEEIAAQEPAGEEEVAEERSGAVL